MGKANSDPTPRRKALRFIAAHSNMRLTGRGHTRRAEVCSGSSLAPSTKKPSTESRRLRIRNESPEESGSESFDARLRSLREAAGLTQEELALRADLSPKAVSALERGERKRPYPHGKSSGARSRATR
jgi:DNA-binding XRE family transcriptional regulator